MAVATPRLGPVAQQVPAQSTIQLALSTVQMPYVTMARPALLAPMTVVLVLRMEYATTHRREAVVLDHHLTQV